MNTRILKKINNRIRIEPCDKGYDLQVRERKLFGGYTEWSTINTFASLKNAIRRKNNHIIILIRELGYYHDFVVRRMERKLNKKK
jgi:hypothetical protein